MKTKLIYFIFICLFCLGCSKADDENPSLLQSSAVAEFSSTNEFKALSSSTNALILNEARVVAIPNKNINALLIPHKTNDDKLRFAVVYAPSDSKFNSPKAKTLVIELTDINEQAVINSIKAGTFVGFTSIYDASERILYRGIYENNKLVLNTNSVQGVDPVDSTVREEQCSVDGIGSCAGKKFEEMGPFSKAGCVIDIILCMALLAGDCVLENC